MHDFKASGTEAATKRAPRPATAIASTEQHELPAGGHLSEAVFVPRRENGPEGEGYLMLNVYKFNEDRSDYVMLDAENLSSGPLATIALPHRIPFTPHGNWRSA